MGRRTVGLLLVTGFVAAGVPPLVSNAEELSRTSAAADHAVGQADHAVGQADNAVGQNAEFRFFASRGVRDAVTPALRVIFDGAPQPTAAHSSASSIEGAAGSAALSVDAPPADVRLSQATAKPSVSAPPGPGPSGSAANPPPISSPTGSWPKTLPEAKAEAVALANPQAVAQAWPQAEIELAKARCTAILKGIDAVTVPEPAMRQGDCGAPAPVRLVSVGRNPEVALSPPPVLTCDMVVALHTWVKSDLQPLARKHLGAAVIKIETMSDYSCRNAYGRTKSRLSEHGKANALDIRGFVTTKGEPAMLLADWGMTARDIAAQVAVAKAEAEKKAREKAASDAAAIAARSKDKSQPRAPGTSIGRAPSELAAQPGAPGLGAPGSALGFRDGGATLSEGLPKVKLTIPGVAPDDDDDKPRRGAVFGVVPEARFQRDESNRLGGPVPPRALTDQPSGVVDIRAEKDAGRGGKTAKPTAPAAAPALAAPAPAGTGRTSITHAPASSRDQTSGKAIFLREAHATGCRIFGTILGPEANNAHRNHFHVDMAERKTTNFCE